MSGRYALALFLVAGWLTGCTALQWSAEQHYPSVQRLITQQHFGEAMEEIERLSIAGTKDPRLQKLRNEVVYQAFRFEQQTIAEASIRQEEGDWRGAIQIMDDALERYPESQVLQRHRNQFRTEQVKQLATLDIDLMLARASWLLQQRVILTKKQALGGDEGGDDAERLESIESELRRLHPALIAQGEEALKADKLQLTQRCVRLAEEIEISDATQRLSAELDARNRQRATRIQARRRAAAKRKSQAELQAHLERARAALLGGKLNEAREAATAGTAIEPHHPELVVLNDEIERRITQRTQALIAEGSSLYRRGEFYSAHDRWAEAVELDPDNTLVRAHLERAERVIEKLERLRQQQSGE